jgi:hypothetical protein
MRRPASDLSRVVSGVVARAVTDAGAGGVVVLDDWTPEGELTYEWLVSGLGEDRVWRGASLASNVHGADPDARLIAAWRGARERSALLAHPASKTTLLLNGPLPRADLFPLGDVYASQVVELAKAWTVPPDLAGLIGSAGLAAVDAALQRLVDGRETPASACRDLPMEAAQELIHAYEGGRWYRLRRGLVPKLCQRTLGIDLFD